MTTRYRACEQRAKRGRTELNPILVYFGLELPDNPNMGMPMSTDCVEGEEEEEEVVEKEKEEQVEEEGLEQREEEEQEEEERSINKDG